MADVPYLNCPMCGWNRPLNTKDRGERRFEVKPEFDVVSIRRGGGYGTGFVRVAGAGARLRDLRASYPDLYANIRQSAREILVELGGP